MWKVRYAWSLVISLALVVLLVGIASIPSCDDAMFLLLPGAFLAAVVFPDGVNSNAGVFFLVLAGVVDIALIAFLVMWAWGFIERRSKARSANGTK